MRLEVEGDRIRATPGLLRAQRVPAPDGWVRAGLVTTTALLLGGDEVDIDIRVAAGSRLALFDVAGTVAYHGRGRPCSWRVQVDLGPGAELVWAAEPLVVADGADVRRTTVIRAAAGSAARIRETLVLGRSGERGGELRSRSAVSVDGVTVMLEDLHLAAETRGLPGILGTARVVDSVLGIGCAPPEGTPEAVRLTLPGNRGWLLRYLGTELARSPIPMPQVRSSSPT